MARKKVLREAVVENACACANHRLSLPKQIIRCADPRAEVVEILRIQLALLLKTNRRVINAQLIAIRANYAIVIPAKTQVDHQSAVHMNSILNVQSVGILVSVSRSVSDVGVPAIESSTKEFCKAIKIKLATLHKIVERFHRGPPEFVAELDVVATHFPRKIIDKLPVRIHAITWV